MLQNLTQALSRAEIMRWVFPMRLLLTIFAFISLAAL